MIIRNVVAGISLVLLASTTTACGSSDSDDEASNDELNQGSYDTIIVGAGIAGLTAAKELKKAGRSFIVLEAQNRIGGRAFVETKKFSVPIDYGAAWLHGVEGNQLVAIADSLGMHRADTNLQGGMFVGNHLATQQEQEACDATGEELETALAAAAQRGDDPAVSTLIPANAPCRDIVEDNVGRYESAAEVDQTSAIDSASFESDNDDFIREGIGTFVATYGKDVPVRLNSEVKKIAYGTGGVTVTLSSSETFHAKTVLSTVSNGILASGKIAFEPALPAWKQDAIKALPMGTLDKVVMEFDGTDIFGALPDSSWVLYDGPGHDNMAFVIKPLGAPIAVGFYGGNQALEYEKSDQKALDNAKNVIGQMFGSAAPGRMKSSDLTHWAATPWTLGSYSSARPGGSKMHTELAKPVDNVLFFAGEACGTPRHNGSLAGAYESAVSASDLIVRSLRSAN
jgi:monoamine oxidase